MSAAACRTSFINIFDDHGVTRGFWALVTSTFGDSLLTGSFLARVTLVGTPSTVSFAALTQSGGGTAYVRRSQHTLAVGLAVRGFTTRQRPFIGFFLVPLLRYPLPSQPGPFSEAWGQERSLGRFSGALYCPPSLLWRHAEFCLL